jgi:hypothetical protein
MNRPRSDRNPKPAKRGKAEERRKTRNESPERVWSVWERTLKRKAIRGKSLILLKNKLILSKFILPLFMD